MDAATISGLEHLKSIKEGTRQLPPAAKLVGYRLSNLDKGHGVFELKPRSTVSTTIHLCRIRNNPTENRKKERTGAGENNCTSDAIVYPIYPAIFAINGPV